MTCRQPGDHCGCNRSCAEALFQWFDCVNCSEEFTCYWWLQFVTSFAYDGFGRYYTPIGNQTLIGPITSPPGPVACIGINDDGDIEVYRAGYVHMLPNSGSVTATVNGNAAYTWSHYDAGDILVGTYNIPTSGNPCLNCHGSDPIDCTETQNDIVPPFNP